MTGLSMAGVSDDGAAQNGLIGIVLGKILGSRGSDFHESAGSMGKRVAAHRRWGGMACAIAAGLVISGHLFSIEAGEGSAGQAIGYLSEAMDEYHTNFNVYEDVSSAGNHFFAWAKIPSADAPATVNGSWTDRPHSGATAIRCEFDASGNNPFAGFYFQNGLLPAGAQAPIPNFGTVPNAGVDLSDATQLTFWARGEHGGERIEFLVAGVGRDAQTGLPLPDFPFPDSSPRFPASGTLTPLTNDWRQYTIDLHGLNLSYVLGGFGWVASAQQNPSGAVFFLDDIRYELSPAGQHARLALPRFTRSFETLPVEPDPFDSNTLDDIDLVLRNLAFTYDNAVALLAFLASGTDDGVRRARLIGDAFVYAAAHDRTYDDGRLRTAYMAGDLVVPAGWTPNGRVGTVSIPGFFYEPTQTFYEVQQRAVDEDRGSAAGRDNSLGTGRFSADDVSASLQSPEQIAEARW